MKHRPIRKLSDSDDEYVPWWKYFSEIIFDYLIFQFSEKFWEIFQISCLQKLQNKKFDIQRKAEKVQISQKF